MLHLHLVIPGWLSAVLGGGALYGALIILTPHLSGKRRFIAAVLLAWALVFFIGAFATAHIG